MQVKQIIEASAEVVTITSLKAGSVYKRVESTYNGELVLRFGVVQDVMNNGEDSAFTALEYRTDYAAGVVLDLKVYDGGKPVALFAATPDEVRSHVEELVEAAQDKLRRARAELDKAREVADRAVDLYQQVVESGIEAPEVVRGEVSA